MEYSELILKQIEACGFKTYAVSKATGITESTFSNWRKSPTSKMDMSNVFKVANFLNISVDYLLTGKELQKKSLPPISEDKQKLYEYIDLLTHDERMILQGELKERTKGREFDQAKAV